MAASCPRSRYSNLDNGNDGCTANIEMAVLRYSKSQRGTLHGGSIWAKKTRTRQAAPSSIEAALHPKRYKRNYRAGPDRLEHTRGSKHHATAWAGMEHLKNSEPGVPPACPVAEIGTWSGPPEQNTGSKCGCDVMNSGPPIHFAAGGWQRYWVSSIVSSLLVHVYSALCSTAIGR